MTPSPGRGGFRTAARVLGKYGASSLSATALDFMAFHAALSWLRFSAVEATVVGRSVGAFVSFLLQWFWVFKGVVATRLPALVVKYLSGVSLGLALNVGGVWLLHDICGWLPWPARVTTALTGWFLIFLFNRHVVFNVSAERGRLRFHDGR